MRKTILSRRRAVSTMIGGIIVLSLILTALGTMVFVSQQYDSYQNIVDRMSQYDIARSSESLLADYPGLVPPQGSTPTTCGLTTCNQYSMSLSNVGALTNAGSGGGSSGGNGGGVGVQIVRVYINSTYLTGFGGCVFPIACVLDPASTPTAYRFRASDSFLNVGEFNHTMLLWLPTSIGLLPDPYPPVPKNTISIVTSRGRVFSFQWPFPPVGTALAGQNGVSIGTGVMKIAYQGAYDSSKEGSGLTGYCHNEAPQPYPAQPGYKETLTGILGVQGNSLTFVNPWITDTIMQTVYSGTTTLYIFAQALNVNPVPITMKGGNLVIITAQSGANAKEFFIGGLYYGTYYKGTFHPAGSSNLSIQPTDTFYLIYQMTYWTHNIGNGAAGLLFTGTAAFTDQGQDQTYTGGEVVLDGLYDRTSCTSP